VKKKDGNEAKESLNTHEISNSGIQKLINRYGCDIAFSKPATYPLPSEVRWSLFSLLIKFNEKEAKTDMIDKTDVILKAYLPKPRDVYMGRFYTQFGWLHHFKTSGKVVKCRDIIEKN